MQKTTVERKVRDHIRMVKMNQPCGITSDLKRGGEAEEAHEEKEAERMCEHFRRRIRFHDLESTRSEDNREGDPETTV